MVKLIPKERERRPPAAPYNPSEDGTNMTERHRQRAGVARAAWLVVGLGSLALLAGEARAQQGPYASAYPNVIIDMSVLDDSGRGAAYGGRAPAGRLKAVPAGKAVSQFHAPPGFAQPPALRGDLGQSQFHPPAGSGGGSRTERVTGGPMVMGAPPTNLGQVTAGEISTLPPVSLPPDDGLVRAPRPAKTAAAPKTRAPSVKTAKATPAAAAPTTSTFRPMTAETPPMASEAPAKPMALAKAAPPPPVSAKRTPVTSEAVPPPPSLKDAPAAADMPAAADKSKTDAKVPPPAPPKQMASLPTGTDSAATGTTAAQVVFGASSVKLPDDAKGKLQAVAGKLAANSEARLQLLAYAGGDQPPSQARRLSLSRALAVRSSLIDLGVASNRIDVRALGEKVTEGDPNRVDVVLLDR